MSSDKPLRVYAPPLASLFWGTLTANGNTNANVTSSYVEKFSFGATNGGIGS